MDDKKLLSIVNGSGFPLQIAVEAIVSDKQHRVPLQRIAAPVQ